MESQQSTLAADTSAMDMMERIRMAVADRYVIEAEIDSGGMATVYRARDLKHERTVAIKVLRPGLVEAVGADRFLREIRTTANLSHPHILPLFDSGDASGLLYYVMPFVRGESLRDRLEREGQLPLEDAVRIAREAADALAYAHKNGVVHRDIKPANILLEEGQPRRRRVRQSGKTPSLKPDPLLRTSSSTNLDRFTIPNPPSMGSHWSEGSLKCLSLRSTRGWETW